MSDIWTPEKIATLREMAEDGETNVAISQAVGIPESTVRRMRVRLSLPLNGRLPDAGVVAITGLEQAIGYPPLDQAAAELRERMVALDSRLAVPA